MRGVLIMFALLILVGSLAIYTCEKLEDHQDRYQRERGQARVLSGHELQEFRRLLRKHGLHKQIAVVEVDNDGMWFVRKGQRVRFQ